MKSVLISALLLAGAVESRAQDRITVPLSNPSLPVTLNVHVTAGGITVTRGSTNEVVVSSQPGQGRPRRRQADNPPPGMHRIEPTGGLEAREDHNVVTISNGAFDPGSDLTIETPVNTSVDLKTTVGGRIDVSGLDGDVNAEVTNGGISVTNVFGSVSAHTLNGPITVSLDRVAPDKPMSFTSLNGKIDVTLPAATKARLRLKSFNGDIYTDFDVKSEPDGANPVVQNDRSGKYKYKIRVDRGFYGSINGGGPEFLFQTLNGQILIHKRQ